MLAMKKLKIKARQNTTTKYRDLVELIAGYLVPVGASRDRSVPVPTEIAERSQETLYSILTSLNIDLGWEVSFII